MAVSHIFYYLPEDNEESTQFNTFTIYKAVNEISLDDIRTYFPLPGEYHFRFQFKFENSLVWLDISNDKGKLPQVDGIILMKVLRKSWFNKE